MGTGTGSRMDPRRISPTKVDLYKMPELKMRQSSAESRVASWQRSSQWRSTHIMPLSRKCGCKLHCRGWVSGRKESQIKAFILIIFIYWLPTMCQALYMYFLKYLYQVRHCNLLEIWKKWVLREEVTWSGSQSVYLSFAPFRSLHLWCLRWCLACNRQMGK